MSDEEPIKIPAEEDAVEIDDEAFEETGVLDEGEGSIYGAEDDLEQDFLVNEDDRDSNY
jgi:hypothetical protein